MNKRVGLKSCDAEEELIETTVPAQPKRERQNQTGSMQDG
jgi:hypothetical protein